MTVVGTLDDHPHTIDATVNDAAVLAGLNIEEKFRGIAVVRAIDPRGCRYGATELYSGCTNMELAFTAVFRKVPQGYIGFVEELPGANTQGKTLEETRENLREAVELV